VASADADPVFHPAGGENLGLSNVAVPSAKAGHWFAALRSDRSLAPGSEDPAYAQDTLGAPRMGRVHHHSRFGFTAFPDSPSAGKYGFIVNEDWPDAPTLQSHWTKLD
jgi:hypothetical protein